jgi:hypothetical protein
LLFDLSIFSTLRNLRLSNPGFLINAIDGEECISVSEDRTNRPFKSVCGLVTKIRCHEILPYSSLIFKGVFLNLGEVAAVYGSDAAIDSGGGHNGCHVD